MYRYNCKLKKTGANAILIALLIAELMCELLHECSTMKLHNALASATRCSFNNQNFCKPLSIYTLDSIMRF